MAQVILKQYNKPTKDNVEKDIEWVCDSFGLSSGRDTSFTSNKIVADILEQAAEQKRIFSETIADNLELSQNLINHHLRNLINSGLIIRERKQIFIRGGSLKEAVREIRKDAMRILDSIELMAEEIDEELGIKNR
ncbi:MAG TPA: ArsR family transcriptional regulator [Candidatus Woesearchaeota archaeon]|nr:ArsR family transcriptional regulator [Candidatus Woesearchaeota archaeon]